MVFELLGKEVIKEFLTANHDLNRFNEWLFYEIKALFENTFEVQLDKEITPAISFFVKEIIKNILNNEIEKRESKKSKASKVIKDKKEKAVKVKKSASRTQKKDAA